MNASEARKITSDTIKAREDAAIAVQRQMQQQQAIWEEQLGLMQEEVYKEIMDKVAGAAKCGVMRAYYNIQAWSDHTRERWKITAARNLIRRLKEEGFTVTDKKDPNGIHIITSIFSQAGMKQESFNIEISW